MSRKLVTTGLLALSITALAPAEVRAEVPEQLIGTWLPLDGFAPVTKPEERPTCIGGERAVETEVLQDDGLWAVVGGGTASHCMFESFRKDGNNRWTSFGGCGLGLATEARFVWTLSNNGTRLKTVGRYQGGGFLVMHHRRCTVAEKIAGIGLPVGEFEHVYNEPDRQLFQVGYAGAASGLCPRLTYDKARATALIKDGLRRTSNASWEGTPAGEQRPADEIAHERLQEAMNTSGPARDDEQIANHELFCSELLKRFGTDGTLIKGLLRENVPP
jgi:hypothetical protein